MAEQAYKILFVDDEVNVLHAFKRQLRSTFSIETCSSPRQALEILSSQGPFAVIVSDMRMPELDGVQFLKEAQRINSNVVRIMLTGNADRETAVRAVNESNIFRFLNKPCTTEDLAKAVSDGIAQYKLIMAEHDLLQNTLSGGIKLLTDILAISDPEAFGECRALRDTLRELGSAGVVTCTWEIELAAMLSPIGLVTLPPQVLSRLRSGAELTSTEAQIQLNLPEVSQRLISHIPRLEGVARIVGYLNKNYDGTGAPSDSLSGDRIPEGARILRAIRDLKRTMKNTPSPSQALAEMQTRSGWYDPHLLSALRKHFGSASQESKIGETESYEVTVGDLCPGQTLKKNIETADGVLLIAAGNVLSQTMIEKIRTYAQLVGVQEPILVDARIPTVNQGVKTS